MHSSHAQEKKLTIRFNNKVCQGLSIVHSLSVFCVFLIHFFCSNSPVNAELPNWAAPALEQAISIRDGRTRKTVSFESFLTDVSQADALFLGESHTDETTHRFQLAIYQRLLASKKKPVVLALEMFERDDQAELDQYLAGKIDESAFLKSTRPWSNYREAYRPLIEAAKQTGSVVIASNFPATIRRRIMMEGEGVLQSLSEAEQQLVPQQFHPNSPAYWQRVDNAVRGHQGMMASDEGDDQRLYSTQSLWDNAMGEACADALDKYPESMVLHLNGGFHSAYWDGTVRQLQLRKPTAKIKTVAIVSAVNPDTMELRGVPIADYVVYVEDLATNVDRGVRSVQLDRDLEYRFHLPVAASNESPVPLLIWLSDDGLTAEEGMALCKERFGDETAIAVVEAPYKSIGEDFAIGGRWTWPDTFAADTGALVGGVERIWAYLLRHYPLDAEHVGLVGEGAGATVAAVIAVQTDRMKLNALAINPRQYAKIKDLSLPLPVYFGDNPPPIRSLRVLGSHSLQAWWQSELEQYTKVDVKNSFELASSDPWEFDRQASSEIRTMLGLPEPSTASSKGRRYFVVETNSPRAKHWGDLQAHRLTKLDGVPTTAVHVKLHGVEAKEISTNISPAAAATAGVLPRCPGPFGGTTVIVLPPETKPEELTAWLAIGAKDPLAATSRFHRVRIATATGDRTLPIVLKKLQAENRNNVLIVPAAFYADLSWLRTLRSSVQEYDDQMTLHWSPGLGGRTGVLKN